MCVCMYVCVCVQYVYNYVYVFVCVCVCVCMRMCVYATAGAIIRILVWSDKCHSKQEVGWSSADIDLISCSTLHVHLRYGAT